MKSFLQPFIEDRDRWFFWTPALVGIGIHLFLANILVSGWWIGIGFLASLLLFYIFRFSELTYVFLGISCIFCGAFSIFYKTYKIEQSYHPLKQEWRGSITGTVEDVEVQKGKIRLLLSDVKGVELSKKKVRVGFRYKDETVDKKLLEDLRPGAKIKSYVTLLPIPPQETPLNYDFQFWSFFEGLEATGYAGLTYLKVWPKDWRANFFDRIRYSIAQKIRSYNLGQAGEIMVAVMVGYKQGIAPDVRDDFSSSGLAHILVIAGLHLSIISGLLFFIFRRLLAFSPKLVLFFPLKKIAAFMALCCSFVYLKISGESIPTIRAFVMFSLIMIGIMMNREPISLRSLTIAALVILGFKPEAIYSASFQMSFSAVLGLIGSYEYFRDQQWHLFSRKRDPWWKRFGMFGLSSVASSLIASIGTLPFIITTFHKFSWHSVEANLIAIPLMSFWVMPWALVAVFSMILGIESLPLEAMSWGVHLMMKLAHEVTSWPGSVTPVGILHPFTIPLLVFGGLWIFIWKNKYRWVGWLGVLFSLTLPTQKVFALVSNDHKRIGILAGEESMLSNNGRDSFIHNDWRGILGVFKNESILKSSSSWIKQAEQEWIIKPFQHRDLEVEVSKQEYPFLKKVNNQTFLEIKGGFALILKEDGAIKVLEVDPAGLRPWRF